MVKDDNNIAKVALLLRTSPTEYMYIVDVPQEVLSWCHKNVKDNRCCIRAVRDMLMLAQHTEQPGRVV